MATRVGPEDVRAIIDVEEGVDLSPFINAANSLVTELCSDSGYDDDRLAMIEAWLAAHFYAIKDMRFASESVGGASGSYHGRTDMYLDATLHGQQAKLLDTQGALSALDKRTEEGSSEGQVGVTWLGTER